MVEYSLKVVQNSPIMKVQGIADTIITFIKNLEDMFRNYIKKEFELMNECMNSRI